MSISWSAPHFPECLGPGASVTLGLETGDPPGRGHSDVRDQGCCQPRPRLSGPSDQLSGGPARARRPQPGLS